MKWYDFYNAFVRGPVPLDLALAIYRGNWNLTLTASRIIICDIPFMRSHEARPYTVPPKSELWGVNTAVPQSKLWEGQSLPTPPDLRHGLQVLHHFLPTGWLPYP